MGSFSGRNVLVTGADGFIGSHLVDRLLREGAEVRAFCAYNPNGSFGWLDELADDQLARVDVRLGDIRDRRFVANAVRDTEIVFHLAALIAIPYSFDAPESYVETNIRGTLNVLESVRDAREVQMIHTSTSEVYGTPETIPITEGHRLRGQSPYAATKIAADQMCEAYARTYGTNVVTLRPFNTYGPRQSARAVIPTILGQLLAGARQVRLGNLAPRRDLTFVEDTVDGFLAMAAARLSPGSLVQLGTGQTVSIGELFALCCEVTGSEAEVVTDKRRARPPAAEVDVLLSDPTKAGTLLNWRASWPLAKGLEETARWMRPRVDTRHATRYHV
ncbi:MULTISPECIES: SDR family NAD(P)-dependent oxidoreductase [unclassified Amycolatopsis]|uniref:SDR family NAD(P)-dependent oxidoreductase n=1 Tax=Amycolatopsis TaxID=1813 RepID=UPI0004897296|nr:SDR family NAD(P)-dependent oxidoreductase [Amycolatopsis sp. ATCC 39116]